MRQHRLCLPTSRKDGQFTYPRELAPGVTPAVAGDVNLPWAGRIGALTGKDVSKLSLETRDKKTVQQRWADIRLQNDLLVQSASLELRHCRYSAGGQGQLVTSL